MYMYKTAIVHIKVGLLSFVNAVWRARVGIKW